MKYLITGPTASGKTDLSLRLAEVLKLPIVNMDSRQMWQNMRGITCSPTDSQLQNAPHLLFNYLTAEQKPSLGLWARSVMEIQQDYVMVGGTMFYGWSLMRGIPMEDSITGHGITDWNVLFSMSPTMAARIHSNDHYRVERAIDFWMDQKCDFMDVKHKYQQDFFVITLKPSAAFRALSIYQRTNENLDLWIEEVKNNQSHNYETIIGYKECIMYLQGQINRHELLEKICLATSQYARKQTKMLPKIKSNVHIEFNSLQEYYTQTNAFIDSLSGNLKC